MPSLSDVANDLKVIQQDIRSNTGTTATKVTQIKNDTAALKTKLDTINTTLTNGFTQLNQTMTQGFTLLSQGLFAQLEAQRQANSLLDANMQQNDAIICWLKTADDLLCRQLHRLNTQIDLQEIIAASNLRTESILELVHGQQAQIVDRRMELEDRIEACCPPKPEKPEHCFTPCVDPRISIYKPRGQDWQVPVGKTSKAANMVKSKSTKTTSAGNKK